MSRFQNYMANLRALEQVKDVLGGDVEISEANESFVLSGVVSKFAVQVELGWKLLAEVLAEKEVVAAELLRSPRGAVKEAQVAYEDDFEGDLWIEMLKARNRIVHMYDVELVRALACAVQARYIPAFQRLESFLAARYGAEALGAESGKPDR